MLFYIKNKKFGLLIFLLCFTGFLSCVHKKNESIEGLEDLGLNYPSLDAQDSILKLNYDEIAPYLQQNGFVWDSFVLPIKKDINISQSDLLIGYKLSEDRFIFPPQLGSCKILENSEDKSLKNRKLVTFMSSNINPKIDAGELILLLDENTSKPSAIVKLNENGKAQCHLPNNNYQVSLNFGSHRKQFALNSEDNDKTLLLTFEKKGVLNISPFGENHIQNGDLIRIGRAHDISQSTLDSFNESLVPNSIPNDIFKSGNFQSQNMGVNEFLFTSFLVGDTPFSMTLNTGNYIIALMRKNSLVCLNKIQISENNLINLTFPKNYDLDLENKIFNRNKFNLTFDPTFFPERLNKDNHFQSWFFSNNSNYIPIKITSLRKNFTNEDEKNQSFDKYFTFLFYSTKSNSVKELSEIFDYDINNKDSALPILGTSFQNIVNGNIPFSNFTFIQFLGSVKPKNIFTNTYLNATNGVEIKLFDPSLTSNGNLMNMVEQQFRFRVTVPSYNPTNVVEMKINDKLKRRWILNRGKLEQAFSITLEEKIFLENSFSVKISAWGENSLPNFMFGAFDAKPYASTREYIVKVVDKE